MEENESEKERFTKLLSAPETWIWQFGWRDPTDIVPVEELERRSQVYLDNLRELMQPHPVANINERRVMRLHKQMLEISHNSIAIASMSTHTLISVKQNLSKSNQPSTGENCNTISLFSYGANKAGQLGNQTTVPCSEPTHILYFSDRAQSVVQVETGKSHSIAITRSLHGKYGVYTWGQGFFGRLGHGNQLMQTEPKLVSFFERRKVITVACGTNHTAAITDDHLLFTWGHSRNGQCGILQDTVSVPHNVSCGSVEFFQVACGNSHTVALSLKNQVYAMGNNSNFQCGTGPLKSAGMQLVQRIKNLQVNQIAAGADFTLAVTFSGNLYGWGRSISGRLGIKQFASVETVSSPKEIIFDSNKGKVVVVKVAVGDSHTLVLTDNGRVFTFGKNRFGECGSLERFHRIVECDGEGSDHSICEPTLLKHLRGVADIFAGGSASTGQSFCLVRGKLPILHQLIRDLDVEQLQSFLRKQENLNSLFEEKDADGLNAVHWAAKAGCPKTMSLLLSHLKVPALLDSKIASSHKTALHLSAKKGFSECVRILISSGAYPDAIDQFKMMPLHLAASNLHLDICNILVKSSLRRSFYSPLVARDSERRTCLDYLTLKQGFSLKVNDEQFFDVVLIFSEEQEELGSKIISLLTSSSIKPWTAKITSTVSELEKAISRAKGMVYLVGPSTVTTAFPLRESLFIAKQLNKPLFPLWQIHTQMPPDTESVVFRYQVLDFSSESNFAANSSSLLHLLEEVLCTSEEPEEDCDEDPFRFDGDRTSSAESGDGSADASENCDALPQLRSILVAYSDTDSTELAQATIQQLESIRALDDQPFQVFDLYNNPFESPEAAARACSAFLLLFSPNSPNHPVVRDCMAVAENKGRPLFVLQTKKFSYMDPGLQYMLSRSPIVTLVPGQSIDFAVQQLIHWIRLHFLHRSKLLAFKELLHERKENDEKKGENQQSKLSWGASIGSQLQR